jgi:predicted RNA-binding Zn-ribbon protein involved in translation (DUF1610 family)
MSVEYTKNLVGKPIVKFDCPKCQLRLSAMLSEAGTHDKCPECGQGFKVPGQQKLKQAAEKRRLALEAKSAAKQKKSEEAKSQKRRGSGSDHNLGSDSGEALAAQQGGQLRQVDDRWLIDPEEMQPAARVEDVPSNASAVLEPASSGSSEFAVPSHEADTDAGKIDSEEMGDKEPADPGGPEPERSERGGVVGRQNRVVASAPRGWWKDSIRFESVSASRYPALMAFRNLMVLLWWIMIGCSALAFVGNPFVLMYNGYSQYSSASRYCDQRLGKYNNAIIDGLLSSADQGQGLTAANASRLLIELSTRDYRGFQVENRIKRNAAVSPQVLASVVADWRAWTSARKAEVNRDRPSVIMATIGVVFLILVYWLALILGLVIYSVMILVPPECIKLIIDIEQGVRGGNPSAPT